MNKHKLGWWEDSDTFGETISTDSAGRNKEGDEAVEGCCHGDEDSWNVERKRVDILVCGRCKCNGWLV
jgi:hypothetical protein